MIDAINTWLTQDIPEDAVMTLTGKLIRIDFDKHLVYFTKDGKKTATKTKTFTASCGTGILPVIN